MPETRDYREVAVGETRRPRVAARAAPRRPAPAPGRAAALLAAGAGVVRVCRRHPGEVFGSAAVLGAVALVSVNALGFQIGRHPAPILPKVPPREAAALPAPRAPVRTVAAEKPPAARDPIGDLIRSEEATASVSPKAAPKAKDGKGTSEASAPKAEPAVEQAQRALTRLGYGPLKADGVAGSATRAAIERFERERGLPVTGQAAGRTLRALQARTATRAGE